MSSDAAPVDHACTLAALRERGADRHDPVRFRFIEALAQRASAQRGAARRVLEEKLAGLLAAYDAAPVTSSVEQIGQVEAVEAAGAPKAAEAAKPAVPVAVPREIAPAAPVITASAPRAAPPVQVASPAPAPRAGTGLLGALVHQLAERNAPALPAAPPVVDGRAAAAPRAAVAAALSTAAPPELKALSYFRRTWSRLSTEQRLAQSAAKLPENAGPLNSQHLVHQSLVLMRDLSPGYLERFIAHVDALMWLDQINNHGSK